MRLSMAISFILATVVGACSTPNPNHCANLQGHATCQKNGDDNIYCSKCVAENNGCVAEVNDSCDAGSTSEPGTQGTSATTTTGDPHPTTSTSTTSTSTGTTDITTTTTTTGDPTTTTGTTVESSTGTTADTSTGTTADTSTGTTADTSTGESTDTTDTTGTTTATTGDTDSTTGPVCGDNLQEPPETCDGTDLNGLDLCTEKNPTKYGGGPLKCAGDCSKYIEDSCCVASGQACPPAPQKCCKNPMGLCVINCG